MFVKQFKKSVATATAVGAVLAVAATSTSGVVTASPDFRNVACTNGYPNPSASNTNLTLTRPIQQYGQRNRANVTVTANGDDGTGKVRISVAGNSWTVPLQDGEASQALPGNLDARETYRVRARFVPDCATGQFAPSSDSQALTVFRANTRIGSVLAPNVERGQRPNVRAVLSTRTKSPHGKAKVVIWKGGQKLKKVVRVDPIGSGDAVIRARFGKVRKLGQWNVKIKYLGNEDCEKATKFTKFRVVR
jgi:hypothetical protein